MHECPAAHAATHIDWRTPGNAIVLGSCSFPTILTAAESIFNWPLIPVVKNSFVTEASTTGSRPLETKPVQAQMRFHWK
jgi:hypothetical protein